MNMHLSTRSKFSLCQLLLLVDYDHVILLLSKYGVATEALEHRRGRLNPAITIRDTIMDAALEPLSELVQEIARTQATIRSRISPRYNFDERWQDFIRCLQLDGYGRARNEYGQELDQFAPIEPIIDGVTRVEDDLTRELGRSGLSEAEELLKLLNASASSFRGGDFNGCLINARVALQTLATAIAKARRASYPGNFDETKWGQVADYLRKSGFINQQQEHGLTGVFSLLSDGAHVPIGFSEDEFTSLGRSLAVSFCYFLTKTLNA
jgi:hypothetical protein